MKSLVEIVAAKLFRGKFVRGQRPSRNWLLRSFLAVLAPAAFAVMSATAIEPAAPVVTNVVSQKSVPSKAGSEDPLLRNLHWMGPINGYTNIFRCACPTMDVAEQMKSATPTEADLKMARERMQRLRDLGVRTVISFQHQPAPQLNDTNVEHWAVALEKTAAKEVGLTYVAHPMSNRGTNSFESMSANEVIQLLDPISNDIFKFAQTGGVAFHCKAGKDRTGLMAGYLRIKYQHWTADQAIEEMRRCGHGWTKFTKDGATNSWHELHLRAIAKMLNPPPP
jgi:protein-tyrosine phosphatase